MTRECMHDASRAGLVTNIDPKTWPPPPGVPHSSRSVCGRDACQEDAIRRVAAATNMTARFYRDIRCDVCARLHCAGHEGTSS